MQRPTEWFRVSFWWIFMIVCMWAVPIAVTILVGLGLAGGGLLIGAILAGILGGEVFGLLVLLPLVWFYKTGVGPEGVRGCNFWGVYRDAPWEDFRSVSPINFLGLRFLRAHTTRGWGPLWLPIFLNDWQGFRDLVLEYAGPEHPLSRAINEEVG
jgi:hypothetical protein